MNQNSLASSLPMAIQSIKRTHDKNFKFAINSTLHKMLRAGKYGTKGTLNFSPAVFCS